MAIKIYNVCNFRTHRGHRVFLPFSAPLCDFRLIDSLHPHLCSPAGSSSSLTMPQIMVVLFGAGQVQAGQRRRVQMAGGGRALSGMRGRIIAAIEIIEI